MLHCCHCISDLTKFNVGRPCSSALALSDDNTPNAFQNHAAIKKRNHIISKVDKLFIVVVKHNNSIFSY